MKMYEISEEAVKALLNYLASKPYGEVFQGIQVLQTLKLIEGAKNEEVNSASVAS